MGESQKTISDWAVATFGDAGSNSRVATRANEEMAELLSKLSIDDNDRRAAEECADVVIVLYRLCERLGMDLLAEIDRKMTINRARTWAQDGSGHGYHRRHIAEAPDLPVRNEPPRDRPHHLDGGKSEPFTVRRVDTSDPAPELDRREPFDGTGNAGSHE